MFSNLPSIGLAACIDAVNADRVGRRAARRLRRWGDYWRRCGRCESTWRRCEGRPRLAVRETSAVAALAFSFSSWSTQWDLSGRPLPSVPLAALVDIVGTDRPGRAVICRRRAWRGLWLLGPGLLGLGGLRARRRRKRGPRLAVREASRGAALASA